MMGLTKCTYDMGFQESPLTYDKGRIAFMDHGEYAPEPGSVPTSSDFTLVENKIDVTFPIHWHDHHLRDITLPEAFEFTASGN
jgi:hypothetical protein